MTEPRFFRFRIWTMVVIAGMSFLALLLFIVFRPPLPEGVAGAHTFSRGAVGHKLLFETLDRLGMDVRAERFRPPATLDSDALLVLAEPGHDAMLDRAVLRGLVQQAGSVLVVLPKRAASLPQGENVLRQEDGLIPVGSSADVLQFFDFSSSVGRFGRSGGKMVFHNMPSPGSAPSIDDFQLIERPADGRLEELIGTSHGILMGRFPWEGRSIYVLSDPDLFANHGMVDDGNAILAVSVIRRAMKPHCTSVVFDEVCHGFELQRSFWRRLLTWPFNLILVHGLIVLFFVLWASSLKLGRNVPLPAAISGGKRFLIDNVVGLLAYYRHEIRLGQKYLDDTVRQVAQQLGLAGSNEDIRRELDRRSRQRNIPWQPEEWRHALQYRAGRGHVRQVLQTVREIHQWKKEMLHER